MSLINITDIDQGERPEAGFFARNNATKLNCNYNILLESGFIADVDNCEAADNNYNDSNVAAIVVADADNIEATGNNDDDNNVVAVADADNCEAAGNYYNIDNKNIASIISPAKNHQNF